MVTAYEGAKYITVFNYPQLTDPRNPKYGVMRDKHFEALRRFGMMSKIRHNSITLILRWFYLTITGGVCEMLMTEFGDSGDLTINLR